MIKRRLALLLLASMTTIAAALATGATAQAAGPHAAAAGFPFAVNIINFSSNKCLQPDSGNPNAIVVQRTCDSANFLQRWYTSQLADGYSFVVNQGTGLCMDLQANSEAEVGSGTLVQQFYCSVDFTTEHWNFVPGSRVNHYQVFNLVKGLCLDLRGRSSANGAPIQVWECKFLETAQEFRFVSA
jgi:hypothetical protein